MNEETRRVKTSTARRDWAQRTREERANENAKGGLLVGVGCEGSEVMCVSAAPGSAEGSKRVEAKQRQAAAVGSSRVDGGAV